MAVKDLSKMPLKDRVELIDIERKKGEAELLRDQLFSMHKIGKGSKKDYMDLSQAIELLLQSLQDKQVAMIALNELNGKANAKPKNQFEKLLKEITKTNKLIYKELKTNKMIKKYKIKV